MHTHTCRTKEPTDPFPLDHPVFLVMVIVFRDHGPRSYVKRLMMMMMMTTTMMMMMMMMMIYQFMMKKKIFLI